MSRCVKIVLLGGGAIVWMVLLFSPIGNVIAVVTIAGLIVVLFACGCIAVK